MNALGDLLTRYAQRYGDRTAVSRGPDAAYSYEELELASRHAEAWLHEVVPHPPFLLLPGNTPGDVALVLGALRSGLVPLIGDPAWSEHEIAETLRRTGASSIVRAQLPASTAASTTLGDGGVRYLELPTESSTRVRHNLDGIDFGRFTSGSSGAPRCLGFGIEAMINAASAWRAATELTGADTVMCLAALNNGLAFNTSLLPVFDVGATLVLPGVRPIPSSMLAALRACAPTILVAFPFVYDALAGRDLGRLTSLRLLVSSAAPLRADTERHWFTELGTHICNYYGLAEVGPVTFNDGRVAGSLGRALAGVDLHEVPTPETERASRTADHRELASFRIAVRTAAMATRYLDPRPPDFADHLDANGSYLTQDLGFLQDGNLFVTGRADRIVNIAGRKIDPGEIADVLLRHHDVSGALVRAEATTTDPLLCAYVESATASRHELIEHCRKYLSQYKIPQRWTIVPALPRSSAGKIMSARLAEIGAAPQ
ncbi:class I adenylate-forming enzyme family protein [Nocardia fluminea]|uniref:class I adenylate-forming enzyme family protein n=1 Tax=Nocardia fluminea TaxID=134984 RepID=UPI0033EE2707